MLIIALSGRAVAQKFDLPVEKREAVVSYADSVARLSFITIAKPKQSGNKREYFWYYANTVNNNTGGFLKNPLDGLYSVFDIKNRLITQGYFKKGMKSGLWIQWYTNGNVKAKTHYCNSYKHGRAFLFNNSGVKTAKLHYRKNKLHGRVLRYFADSTVKERWKKNRFVSKKVVYSKSFLERDTNNQLLTKSPMKRCFICFWNKKQKAEKTKPDLQAEVQTQTAPDNGKKSTPWYLFWKRSKKQPDQQAAQ